MREMINRHILGDFLFISPDFIQIFNPTLPQGRIFVHTPAVCNPYDTDLMMSRCYLLNICE